MPQGLIGAFIATALSTALVIAVLNRVAIARKFIGTD